MGASFRKVSSGIEQNLNGKLTRAKSIRAFFMRVTLPQYYNAQKKRWDTENSSEEEKWDPLTAGYAKIKLKKFADYPGQGKVTMVATGKLAKSAVGEDLAGSQVLATDRSLTISLNTSYIPYAEYASAARPTMVFGDTTTREMKERLVRYIIRGA